MTLNLDPDELNTCVQCGLCLPHCPTFRVTGEEALSPRGRIDAMRAVELRGAPIDDDFVHFVETCVQCRGCEPACPAGELFGEVPRCGAEGVLCVSITVGRHALGAYREMQCAHVDRP